MIYLPTRATPPLTLATASRAAGFVSTTMSLSLCWANVPSSGIEDRGRERSPFSAADTSDARRRRFEPGVV